MSRNKIRILPVSASELRLRRVIATNLLMEASSPKWMWDPSNGMIRIVVVDNLAGGYMGWFVNIWDERLLLRAAAAGWPFTHKFSPWIHEHPYTLRSTVLAGAISHTEYEVTAHRNGAWREWGRTPNWKRKRGRCDVFARPSRQLGAGTGYRLMPGVFHTVVPTTSPTVTFVEQDLRRLQGRGFLREQVFLQPATRSRMEVSTKALLRCLGPGEASYATSDGSWLGAHPAVLNALALLRNGKEYRGRIQGVIHKKKERGR